MSSYKRKRTGLQTNSLLDRGISVPRGPLGSNTRIKHKELIGDVHSGSLPSGQNSTPFSMVDWPSGLVLNPANNITFPWLSQIATSYQEYRFHGLYFQYTSTSGNSVASSNTALGTIIMATNYNAAQPVFTTKQEMEMTEFNNSSKPASSFIHAIECSGHNTPLNELYIGTPSLGEDPKTYNLGTFQLATQGQQAAATTLGELHVFYDVELLKPVLDVSSVDAGLSLYSAHAFNSFTNPATSGSQSAWWPTSNPTSTVVGNPLIVFSSFPSNYVAINNTDNRIFLYVNPSMVNAVFMFTVYIQTNVGLSGNSTNTPIVVSTTNCSITGLSSFVGSSQAAVSCEASGGGNDDVYCGQLVFRVTAVGTNPSAAYVSLGLGTPSFTQSASTSYDVDIVLTQLNNSYA